MTNKNSHNTNQVDDRSEHGAASQASAHKPSSESAVQTASEKTSQASPASIEINGPKGLEPTRYGDWESKGRCSDF